jgi:hypothetical protein
MLDKQTSLLISFFQQAIQVGEVEPDPAKYLMEFRSEIETTGRFFEYLGLAKADKQSPLGWKPTAPLLDLIAKSKPRRAKPTTRLASRVDGLCLSLMLDTVLGRGPHSFCCYVLIRLGLIVEDGDGDWTAAPHLVRLFADVYEMRRLGAPDDPDAVYGAVYTS